MFVFVFFGSPFFSRFFEVVQGCLYLLVVVKAGAAAAAALICDLPCALLVLGHVGVLVLLVILVRWVCRVVLVLRFLERSLHVFECFHVVFSLFAWQYEYVKFTSKPFTPQFSTPLQGYSASFQASDHLNQ